MSKYITTTLEAALSAQIERNQEIIDAATEEMHPMTIETRCWQFSEFCLGQLHYLRRRPLESCENGHQRRGWWSALAQDSACETSAYLRRTDQVIDLDSLPF